MSRLAGLKVLVAGGGAIGSILALTLAEEGASVVLADPAGLGDNASGVAAGMLAPAFEAALDPLSAGHFELFMASRDAWPALAARVGAPERALVRSGAVWAGDEASVAEMHARLRSLGARAELATPIKAETLAPGLVAPAGTVFTPDDWRLEPAMMLSALGQAFLRAGGRLIASAVTGLDGARRTLADGGTIEADTLILATGMPPAGVRDGLPEFAALQPVKGQIARFAGARPRAGVMVRANGVYVTPSVLGPVAGATMEAGVGDRTVDPAAIAQLRERAAAWLPELAKARAEGAAGVRAATPDGLPLVGASSREGLLLALGARRNGWLLAPLIARMIADRLAGAAEGPWDRAFAPGRFVA